MNTRLQGGKFLIRENRPNSGPGKHGDLRYLVQWGERRQASQLLGMPNHRFWKCLLFFPPLQVQTVSSSIYRALDSLTAGTPGTSVLACPPAPTERARAAPPCRSCHPSLSCSARGFLNFIRVSQNDFKVSYAVLN